MAQQAVYTFAKWQVKEGQLESVQNLFSEVIEKSTGEEGNLFYKIHQSLSDPNTFLLYEGYKDEASLETHRNSDHFKQIVVGQIVPLLQHREVVITHEFL
ncbi:putative quinol monooxygenase [Runella sp.]|uniref:putative quinol monooxygenase n=1 Tax=Runella sp. TaxID=1960881 RepID=UPI003D0A3A91